MSGAGAGAAAAAAIAQATKASGAIVRIDPQELIKLLNRAEAPLVVMAPGSFFSKAHKYITSYKGLFFYTESDTPLQLPSGAELVAAEKIWIP
jgi:hypothetical protein